MWLLAAFTQSYRVVDQGVNIIFHPLDGCRSFIELSEFMLGAAAGLHFKGFAPPSKRVQN